MKKINSFILAAFTILSAASCQKEMMNPNDTEANGTPFSFEASRDIDTKTTLVKLEEGTTTYWTPGDKVSVFDKNGAEVEFKTAITENSASALFSCEMISLPEDLNIHAIYPNRGGNATFKDGVINNLRVGGTQKAIAGNFDPEFAVAYASGQIVDFVNPPVLKFKNLHTLVKFTVGGETAPETISLKSFASRMCTGLFYYNTTNGETACTAGGHEVTLIAPEGGFKVGDTYYIALVPGATKQLTLYFDGKVAFTAGEGVIKTLEANKIYNLGEASVEAEPEIEKDPSVKMNATLVASKQSTADNSWLTSLEGGKASMDRNAAFDGTNVYIANVNTTTPDIYVIPVANPENISKVNMTGVEGGYFPMSCVRTIANGDSQILLASNMGMNEGEIVKIYAWENGITEQPTVLCNNWTIPGWAPRRFGDQFTVCGDWTKGELWFRSQSSSTTARYNIENGVLKNPGSPDGWGNLYGGSYLGSVYRHSMSSTNILVVPGTEAAALYDFNGVRTDLKRVYGYIGGLTPFTFDGKNFIAYVSLPGQGASKAKLVVIEDNEQNFETALNDNLIVFEADINSNDNNQTAGNSGMSCNVVTTGGKTYLFGHAQNIGFAVYEITGLDTYSAE